MGRGQAIAPNLLVEGLGLSVPFEVPIPTRPSSSYASNRRVHGAHWPVVPVKVPGGPLNAFSWAPPSPIHPSWEPGIHSSGLLDRSQSANPPPVKRVPQIDCQIIIFSLAFTSIPLLPVAFHARFSSFLIFTASVAYKRPLCADSIR